MTTTSKAKKSIAINTTTNKYSNNKNQDFDIRLIKTTIGEKLINEKENIICNQSSNKTSPDFSSKDSGDYQFHKCSKTKKDWVLCIETQTDANFTLDSLISVTGFSTKNKALAKKKNSHKKHNYNNKTIINKPQETSSEDKDTDKEELRVPGHQNKNTGNFHQQENQSKSSLRSPKEGGRLVLNNTIHEKKNASISGANIISGNNKIQAKDRGNSINFSSNQAIPNNSNLPLLKNTEQETIIPYVKQQKEEEVNFFKLDQGKKTKLSKKELAELLVNTEKITLPFYRDYFEGQINSIVSFQQGSLALQNSLGKFDKESMEALSKEVS